MSATVATLLQAYGLPQRADAEILLAHVLAVNRAYLHGHPEQSVAFPEREDFTKLMRRRESGEPVAYLIGRQAFWSIDLKVTNATLIPRPDTELLVELVLQRHADEKMLVADLGTGSGAIALALASIMPTWEIYATDTSMAALSIAKENAERLAIHHVTFSQGDWCAALPPRQFDIIVSNPPYIAANDVHLMQSVYDYEPHAALFSDENGLGDIRRILLSAHNYLKPGACIFLEHGFQQAAEVRSLLANAGYVGIKTFPDLAGLDRVTIGISR